MTQVAHITPRFRGEDAQEIRGFDEVSFRNVGLAVFSWEDPPRVLVIPLDCTKEIDITFEEDETNDSET